MHTRGIPTRNRRAVDDNAPDTVVGSNGTVIDATAASATKKSSAPAAATVASTTESTTTTTTTTANNVVAKINGVGGGGATLKNDTQRNRRQVPGCIVNYNAQRQLLIGCTQPEVIEVRPQCNEDGDECKRTYLFI